MYLSDVSDGPSMKGVVSLIDSPTLRNKKTSFILHNSSMLYVELKHTSENPRDILYKNNFIIQWNVFNVTTHTFETGTTGKFVRLFTEYKAHVNFFSCCCCKLNWKRHWLEI